MDFEWDDKKEEANIKKHGISFARAATIFTGIVLASEDKRKDYGEIRICSIGQMIPESEGEKNPIVLVAHTNRQKITRIISARPVNKKERRQYYAYVEEKNKQSKH